MNSDTLPGWCQWALHGCLFVPRVCKPKQHRQNHFYSCCKWSSQFPSHCQTHPEVLRSQERQGEDRISRWIIAIINKFQKEKEWCFFITESGWTLLTWCLLNLGLHTVSVWEVSVACPIFCPKKGRESKKMQGRSPRSLQVVQTSKVKLARWKCLVNWQKWLPLKWNWISSPSLPLGEVYGKTLILSRTEKGWAQPLYGFTILQPEKA